MHIGDMNLNHRSSDRPDRILQGNGRMGIGPRIQDDAVRIKTHLLYLVYQLSFDVGLEIVYDIRTPLTLIRPYAYKTQT